MPALEANQINIDPIQQMNMSIDNVPQTTNIYSDRNFEGPPKARVKNGSNLQIRSNRQNNLRRDSTNGEGESIGSQPVDRYVNDKKN